MNTWQVILFSIFSRILGAGILFLLITQPAKEAIHLIPPLTQAPWKIQIVGAVYQPGVYPIAAGGRVQDAIQAAGGLSNGADPQSIYLAKIVQDGERIYVPIKGEYALTSVPPMPTTDDSMSGPLINISTASQEELESLPSIGAVKATEILSYHQTHGAFTAIEHLLDDPGLG